MTGTTLKPYQGLSIHLFVVDPVITEDITSVLSALRLEAEIHQDFTEARKFLDEERPDIVICEEAFFREADRLDELLAKTAFTHMIVLTREPDVVLCVQLMAFDVAAYLPVPVDRQELAGLLARCLERERVAVPRRLELEAAEFKFDGVVGKSAAMRLAVDRIKKAGPTDVPMLILGENGTGKELAARAVHQNSHRASGPFIAVHVGALPETLVEGELFGWVKHAHSTAMSDRIGKIEAADGGTLFLDEIGDIPLEVQVKLLRVLENREYSRIGENRVRTANFRLVAATNRDLQEMIEQKQFREDLYYRIRGVTINLPPLRERTEDIPELVKRFVGQFNEKYPARRIVEVPRETIEAFKREPWRGNIRELFNRVGECVVLSDDGVLRADTLPPALTTEAVGDGIDTLLDGGATLDDVKRMVIQAALEQNDGNRKQTAKQLDIPERTFYRMLDRYELK